MDKAASRIRLRNNCSKTRNPLKSVPYGNFLADSFFILDFPYYICCRIISTLTVVIGDVLF